MGAGVAIRTFTAEQMIEHFDIKSNNYRIKSEQFLKPHDHDLRDAIRYLNKSISLRIELIIKKHC